MCPTQKLWLLHLVTWCDLTRSMMQQSKLRLDGDLYIQLKSTPGFHETYMLYLFELGLNPQMHVWSCVSFYQSKCEADQQLVICVKKIQVDAQTKVDLGKHSKMYHSDLSLTSQDWELGFMVGGWPEFLCHFVAQIRTSWAAAKYLILSRWVNLYACI